MSVRRANAPSAGNAGLMRSALFWVAMLTASFLLGFMVLAPLGNLWYTSRSSAPPAGSQLRATVPNPAPPQPTASAAITTPKRDTERDEPVDISSERTAEFSRDDPFVQQGQEPTQSNSSAGAEPPRGGIRLTPDRVRGANADDERGSLSVETEPSRSTERETPSVEASRTERDSPSADRPRTERDSSSAVRSRNQRDTASVERSRAESDGPSVERPRRSRDDEQHERVSRRSRRPRESVRARSTRPSAEPDVQRGETIDR